MVKAGLAGRRFKSLGVKEAITGTVICQVRGSMLMH